MAVISSLLPETREAACIIPGRLYFIPLSQPPPDVCLPPHTQLLCIDDSLRYEPFWDDFGPLNLACTFRFVSTLHHMLTADPQCVVYYHCNNQREAKSNAAVLVGIYQLLYCGSTAAAAYEPLKVFEPYIPFRDASTGPHTFKLTPYHVIEAMAAALSAGCFTLDSFNVDEYEHFETVQHGDLNTIVPSRFIAFASPHPPPNTATPSHVYSPFTPNDYLPIFRHYNVTSVVRLNKRTYDPKPFTMHGIGHFNLFFPDGSNPPIHLLLSFLALCDRHAGSGVMAVHCKAGLGRTGSLLGCWLMREWGWKATEAIGWLRLCRPGSVIGGQQEWMDEMQARMWLEGDKKRARDGKVEERKEATADMLQSDDESVHDGRADECGGVDGGSGTSTSRLRSYSSREEQANGLLARKAQRVRTSTTSAGATVRATAGVTVIGSRRGSATSAKDSVVLTSAKRATPPVHPNTARPLRKVGKDGQGGSGHSRTPPPAGVGTRSAQISPVHHTRTVLAAATMKESRSSKASTSPMERSTAATIAVYRS